MSKHKIGRISLITIFLIILIIVVILIAVRNANKAKMRPDNEVQDDITPEHIEYIEKWSGKVGNIENLGDYSILKNILKKFYMNYSAIYTDDNVDNYFSNATCNLLAEDYKSKYDINTSNIKDKFSEIEDVDIVITNGYKITDFEQKTIYYVEYLTKERTSQEYKSNKVIVVCKVNDNIFELYLEDYVDSLNLPEFNIGDVFNVDLNVEFEKNEDNSYGASNYNYEDYAEDKLEEFRKMIINSPENAYELLDDEFKASKYPTYESFKSFIDANTKDIFLLTYGSSEISGSGENAIFTIYDNKDILFIKLHTHSLTNVNYEIEKYI